MSSSHGGNAFISLSIAVLTVSDTRDESNDTSGQALVERVTEAGHKLAEKAIRSIFVGILNGNGASRSVWCFR